MPVWVELTHFDVHRRDFSNTYSVRFTSLTLPCGLRGKGSEKIRGYSSGQGRYQDSIQIERRQKRNGRIIGREVRACAEEAGRRGGGERKNGNSGNASSSGQPGQQNWPIGERRQTQPCARVASALLRCPASAPASVIRHGLAASDTVTGCAQYSQPQPRNSRENADRRTPFSFSCCWNFGVGIGIPRRWNLSS